jgi:hypothetical protein
MVRPSSLLFGSLLLVAACGGGSKGGGPPPPPPNTPPTLQAPPGLSGAAPQFLLTLPIAESRTLTFTALDAEGGPLTWQVAASAPIAAAGVSYSLPFVGSEFVIQIGSSTAPIGIDLTVLVEDSRGAAAAIDLRVVRSGPPTIASVAPGSAFTTRPQSVRIRGSALQLGGSALPSASFDSIVGTGLTVVSDTEVRCATPTTLTVGPTVVGVSTQFGAASLPGSAFAAHAFPPDLFATDARIDAGAAASLEFAREGKTVHAVWREGPQLVHRVSADSGATWSTPLLLSGAEVATEPRVLVSGSSVLVGWIGDGTSVQVRRSSDAGATFAAAQRLDATTPTTPAQRPRFAASGDRRFVAWIAGDTGLGAGRLLAVGSANAGVDWTAATEVAPAGVNQRNHELVSDGNTAWALFEDDRLGAPARGAYAARTLDGGVSWLPVVRLNAAATAASDVGLCFGGGRLYGTWIQSGGLRLSTSIDRGATWGAPTELQNAASGAVAAAAVACDDNQLVAAFVVGGTNIATVSFAPNGATLQPVTVESTASASAEPRLAISGNYVFVAWREGDVGAGTARVQFAVSTNNAGTFGAATGFGDGTAAQSQPRLCVDGANVLFGWIDARGTTSGVFTNRTED